MKMIFLPTSSNKKTGDIMQSYSSRSTCHKSCVFNHKVVIIFGIHGAHKGKARKAIQIHQAKL